MIDLIEQIGPYLGIAAFVALAVLAFLVFQQAREIRRLREWAGRAPERADEAAEASLAAAEARGEVLEEEAAAARGAPEGRFGAVRGRFTSAYDGLDRRMPFDPRYLLAPLLAAVVAAAVLTSGFGLVGGDDGGNNRKGAGKNEKKDKPEKVEVAVLNATQGELGLDPVDGLAGRVADAVVKPAGFKAGVESNAPEGFAQTVIMFDTSDAEANSAQADKLAAAVSEQLGDTPVEEMSGEIEGVAKGAPVALVIGRDDAEF